MPPCRIDPTLSRRFQRLVKDLKKKHPRIEQDLADAFAEIGKDYKTACHANAVLGFAETVWKYRCASRDMRRGRSGGFRIVAYVDSSEQCLYPILIFAKSEQSDESKEMINNAVKALREALTQEDLPFESDE